MPHCCALTAKHGSTNETMHLRVAHRRVHSAASDQRGDRLALVVFVVAVFLGAAAFFGRGVFAPVFFAPVVLAVVDRLGRPCVVARFFAADFLELAFLGTVSLVTA